MGLWPGLAPGAQEERGGEQGRRMLGGGRVGASV